MSGNGSSQTQAMSRSDETVNDKTSLWDEQHEDLERLERDTGVFYISVEEEEEEEPTTHFEHDGGDGRRSVTAGEETPTSSDGSTSLTALEPAAKDGDLEQQLAVTTEVTTPSPHHITIAPPVARQEGNSTATPGEDHLLPVTNAPSPPPPRAFLDTWLAVIWSGSRGTASPLPSCRPYTFRLPLPHLLSWYACVGAGADVRRTEALLGYKDIRLVARRDSQELLVCPVMTDGTLDISPATMFRLNQAYTLCLEGYHDALHTARRNIRHVDYLEEQFVLMNQNLCTAATESGLPPS